MARIGVFTHDKDGHAIELSIGGLDIYISYKTIVGFSGGTGKYAVVNTFSRTTGRHYTSFGLDKANYVSQEEFNYRYHDELAKTLPAVAAGCRLEAREAKKRWGDQKKREASMARDLAREKKIKSQHRRNKEKERRLKLKEIEAQVLEKATQTSLAHRIVAEEMIKGGPPDKIHERARLSLLRHANYVCMNGPPDSIVRVTYKEVEGWVEELRRQAGV